jgi:hypothetical protein
MAVFRCGSPGVLPAHGPLERAAQQRVDVPVHRDGDRLLVGLSLWIMFSIHFEMMAK